MACLAGRRCSDLGSALKYSCLSQIKAVCREAGSLVLRKTRIIRASTMAKKFPLQPKHPRRICWGMSPDVEPSLPPHTHDKLACALASFVGGSRAALPGGLARAAG